MKVTLSEGLYHFLTLCARGHKTKLDDRRLEIIADTPRDSGSQTGRQGVMVLTVGEDR